MPEDIFADLQRSARVSARANRDINSILRKNLAEGARVLADLVRLARGNLPAAQSKKLRGSFGLWQLDSGRYRAVYAWIAQTLYIFAVFPKPDQRKVLKHLRA